MGFMIIICVVVYLSTLYQLHKNEYQISGNVSIFNSSMPTNYKYKSCNKLKIKLGEFDIIKC